MTNRSKIFIHSQENFSYGKISIFHQYSLLHVHFSLSGRHLYENRFPFTTIGRTGKNNLEKPAINFKWDPLSFANCADYPCQEFSHKFLVRGNCRKGNLACISVGHPVIQKKIKKVREGETFHYLYFVHPCNNIRGVLTLMG